jgi:subtilisin family serine protease
MNPIQFESVALTHLQSEIPEDDADSLNRLALRYLSQTSSVRGTPCPRGVRPSVDPEPPAPLFPPPASVVPNPYKPQPEGVELLVIDLFQNVVGVGSSTLPSSHGAQTSYVAGASSDSASVELLRRQVESNAEFADQLNAIASSGSPPEVISLSVGLDPATEFSGELLKLNSRFDNLYGADRSQWRKSTWARYKDQVLQKVNEVSANVEKALGGVPEQVKAAFQSLVNAGVTVTIAGGNQGGVQTLLSQLDITPPAGFFEGMYLSDLPDGVIVVGASESNAAGSSPASFTNAKDAIDVAADGTDVQVSTDGQTKNGTSFSAPYVAGLVADMKVLDPTLTPAAIEEILKQSADFVRGEEARLGSGVVNREDALAMAS